MKNKNRLIDIMNHSIIDDITKRRLIYTIKITVFIIAAVYAFGAGCKIVNFSMKNFMELKKTLQ